MVKKKSNFELMSRKSNKNESTKPDSLKTIFILKSHFTLAAIIINHSVKNHFLEALHAHVKALPRAGQRLTGPRFQ